MPSPIPHPLSYPFPLMFPLAWIGINNWLDRGTSFHVAPVLFAYRDIVAAAHLRPLEKKDRISESKLQQPWNAVASPANQSTALTQSYDVGQVIISYS